jgi:hypothetical protein
VALTVVRVYGGLGNQLFQYATGRRVAVANDSALKLDLGWFAGNTDRRYALAPFRIAAAPATRDDISLFLGRRPQDRLRRQWARLVLGARPRRVRPRSTRFEPSILALRGCVYLDGYWQSERYFSDIRRLIREELTVKTELAGRNAAVAAEIRSTHAVSVHVRRGDYVSRPETAAVHGTCPLDYYDAAAARVVRSVPDARFFVFSDEPAWAAENLRLARAMTVVDHNGPGSEHEDLRLMTLCRHHIIANSSFSWWGAWLCDHPDKTVIAPKRWFRTDELDPTDIVPQEWERL